MGADECVLHRDGFVTECCHSNVQILKNGMLISHPDDQFILRGIAKTHMIQACRRLGITVMERPFSLEELYDADEVLLLLPPRCVSMPLRLRAKRLAARIQKLSAVLKRLLFRNIWTIPARQPCWIKTMAWWLC
mgnify:CR=1 FL=1